MQDSNTLLRDLREQRNLSQAKLSEGISNRGTVASYETVGGQIKFEILRQYLDRLNVSLEEFDAMTEDHFECGKKELSEHMHNLYSRQLYSELRGFIDEAKQKYDETVDFFYYHLFAQYTLVLERYGLIQLDPHEKDMIATEVKVYLDSIDTWGQFELSVFISTMYLFESEFICQEFRTMKKKDQKFKSLYYKYAIVKKFYVNACILFMERQQPKMLAKMVTIAKKNITVDDMKLVILLHYFEGASKKDEAMMNQTIETFKIYGFNEYANELDKIKMEYLASFENGR